MNRISSTAVTVALAATLLAATAPAAHARNTHKPQPAASVTGGWFDATLAWLGGFLVSAPQTVRSVEKTTIYPIPIVYKPMTCSTIDPNGSTACGGGY